MTKDFDYILDKHVGGGGWWQWKRVIILSTLNVALGVPTLMHVFTAFAPPHRCLIDGCDDPSFPVFALPGNQSFLANAIPRDDGASTFLK